MSSFWCDLASLFYIVPIKASYTSLEEVPDYVQSAIPFFILLILLEFVYGKWRNYPLYNLKDTIMSLSLGLVQQTVGIWIKELSIVPYIYVYNYFLPYRLKYYPQWTHINDDSYQIVQFIFGLLAVDLSYYWFHRLAHEWHFMWASHSVHHSGERYNLATALRQGAFQSCSSWVFYLPYAVLGLHPTHFIRHSRLNLIYQFWFHTEVVGRLPMIIELIFNTASHHRLHHRPPGNCNYGGVLIIWDRIFGTFVSECTFLDKTLPNEQLLEYQRGVIYGLAKPLDTYDPVKANIQHYQRIAEITSTSEKIESHPTLLQQFQTMWIMLFRKRVHHPLKISSTLQELIPDILYDWKHLQIHAKNSLFARIVLIWNRIWSLPPLVHTPEALSQLNQRDREFIEGRNQRECPTLSYWALIQTILHFLFGFGLILALLENQHSISTQPSIVKIFFAIAAALGIITLQTIRCNYSASGCSSTSTSTSSTTNQKKKQS